MDVEIEGKRLRLAQQQVIGVGGEGTVFLASVVGQPVAVKIYHTPTSLRQEKVRAFLAQSWDIPRSRVALPLQPVRDTSQGNIIGLTMPYLGPGCEPLARLASKKQRVASPVSTRDIVRLFLDGTETLTRIHRSGLVVGDFNDQNALYQDRTMLWIDLDAWQFAPYACPVATEDFVAPELYGIDLSMRPVFIPEHDWYSFAVHLFRGLLLAHPYGGTHKEYQTLTKRAQQKIFVLNSEVTYPKMAYTPDLLSDDLAHVFERIFARGWRGPFPYNVLSNYYDSLEECSACKRHYPRERRFCPFCQSKHNVIVQAPQVSSTGVRVTDLLLTRGKIVFAKVHRDMLYALAYEDSNAVLYSGRPGTPFKRKELFKEIPGARYDLIDHTLIVNPPQTTRLLFLDVSGEQPVALGQAETALFAGTRQAMFQASANQIFAIVNNALICGTLSEGALSGRALRTVMAQQTWFSAAPTTTDGQPTVFGFFQVFRQQLFWLIRAHAIHGVALPVLHEEEALIDIAISYSNQGALVRRLTHERGSEYLRTEIIDNQGTIVYTGEKMKRTDHPYPAIHGHAYATGIALHATDSGIVQERIAQHTFKTFATTVDYVQEGDILEPYQSGLLLIREDRLRHLIL